MKRTIAFLLGLVIMVSVTACASKGSTKTAYPQTPEEARELLIEAYRDKDAEKYYLVKGIDLQGTARNTVRAYGNSLERVKSRSLDSVGNAPGDAAWRERAELISSFDDAITFEIDYTKETFGRLCQSTEIIQFINSLGKGGKIYELVGSEKQKALELYTKAFADIYRNTYGDNTIVSIYTPEDITALYYLDLDFSVNGSGRIMV